MIFKWECRAEISEAVKFCQVIMTVEGYHYDDDPYILDHSFSVSLHKN